MPFGIPPIALAIIVGVGSSSVTSAQQPNLIDGRAIDRVVRAQVDSGFSGVVLVAIGDSVILRRAYNAHGARLTTASVFRIASMTKGFAAAAILALEERGKLRVTDSLFRFFPGAPADKRSITIDQLLTHAAGFAAASTGAGITGRSAAVKAILATPLNYEPGLGYEYGNDDYELLAAIIEVASGQSWQQFVSETLIQPAALKHTSAAAEDWGHRGANGMTSTADDLLRWTLALRRGSLLTAQSRDALLAPRVFVRTEQRGDVYSGYGARIYRMGDSTVEVLQSGSGAGGHNGMVIELPPEVTLIVLSNAGSHQRGTWSSYVANLIVPP